MANDTNNSSSDNIPSLLSEDPGPTRDRIILWVMTVSLLATSLVLDISSAVCLWILPAAVLYPLLSTKISKLIKNPVRRDTVTLSIDTFLISAFAYYLQPGIEIFAAYLLMLLYQGISHFGYKLCFFQIVMMTSGAGSAWFIYSLPLSLEANPILKGIAFFSTLSFFLYHGYFFRNRQYLYVEKVAAERKEMQKQTWLTTTMANYLSPQVRELIYRGKDKMQRVETRRRRLTVFFSDIEGFTQLSDELEPEALSTLLNDYLDEMSRIALRHGGTIDKYIGDSIMVFFGDPTSHGDRQNARAALAMAIEMRRHMKVMRKKWRNQGIIQSLNIRMGISTGYCNVGNFGTRERMDY
uniref:adenylate/guanylate cyclase domain-containing protein n=1 Tax=Parendozoicomonas sp. Alg238-R29 TaxID=2993446 RepID=UPI00248EC114